jgi:hypothetical protein
MRKKAQFPELEKPFNDTDPPEKILSGSVEPVMIGSSHPNHEKWPSAIESLEWFGQRWQLIEAPRGRPFLGRRRFIALPGMALPNDTGIVQISYEIITFTIPWFCLPCGFPGYYP